MEHRLLEYFIAVSEELHFTKAADNLGISQPTLSHQIRLLEEQLGTPLFHRSGKKIHLTQAGTVLLEHARRVFHELEQAKLVIGELTGLRRGRLRIGCSGNHLLIQSIISFHRQFPGIELSIVELATEETRDRLLTNKLDLGVVFLPLKDEQLISLPLYKEELVVIVPQDHPFAESSGIELRELALSPLVLFPPKFLARQMLDAACAEIGIQLSPVIELSTMESQCQMVAHHVGLTVVPKSYTATLRDPRLVSVPIAEPAPYRSVGIVYRKDTYMDAAIQAFIEHLSSNLQTD
ncbi:LysR substrate-binding domain-containing protein [Paenibacillus woosongensis]|uniref:LysR family transcriptional regulator n=1 Tax=Paenibacillus woosongensis TaxID=307580 RepID=A0AA95I7R7_9BACL|nr:LysR substrate-binding domain-containing protein [Paenibacillus woosongensis]WHX47285.1 LysR substrate-binding domain-containing protein [Paenibacillus woosongensis]GIP59211.1 LysR family transcriptional regulator [Paenibacillus woosongensis]